MVAVAAAAAAGYLSRGQILWRVHGTTAAGVLQVRVENQSKYRRYPVCPGPRRVPVSWPSEGLFQKL